MSKAEELVNKGLMTESLKWADLEFQQTPTNKFSVFVLSNSQLIENASLGAY